MAEKTEEPTPRRVDEARRRGDVARSRDLGTLVVVLSTLVAFGWGGPDLVDQLRSDFDAALSLVLVAPPSPSGAFLRDACERALLRLLPPLAAIGASVTLVTLVETRALFAPARLVPQLDRIDPGRRLVELVSRRSLLDALRSLSVILGLAWAFAPALADAMREASVLVARPPSSVLRVLSTILVHGIRRALPVLVFAAVVDVWLVRRRHRTSLRMTRDELRREHKDGEGDPHAKAARARLHREILEHRILESVRDADVLVVNPTHLAVALRFDPHGDDDAPVVLAKGEEWLARRMIDVARAHGVPVMRDVPLARGLYELELGDEIPEALYAAVAAVLRAAWDERDRD